MQTQQMRQRVLAAVLIAATLSSVSVRGMATEFRRPFDEAISLGYGYDHDGGGGGCTAYDCGGRCYNGHRGNDYPLPYGTNVRAAAAGTVTYVSQGCADVGYYCSQCGGGFGNYVRVRHADGRDTYYGHLKNGSVVVSTGQAVSCGQKLAQSASSGCSTGYHLHFDLRGGSSRLDPYAGACAAGSSDWVSQGSGMPSADCENVCACNPGETQSSGCGNCGTRSRACASNCQWGDWSGCAGEGECAAGDLHTQSCGDCGGQARRCGDDCRWGPFGACAGPDPDGGERACDAGGLGPCSDGRVRCRDGNLQCEALFAPTDELCDDIDNDCDGEPDDGSPLEVGDPAPTWAAELVDASWPRVLDRRESGEVWADFRNVGNATWPAGQVWLQAESTARDEVSPLRADSWTAWDVPGVVWQDVLPGEVARVAFEIRHEGGPAVETFTLRTPEGELVRCPAPSFDVALGSASAGPIGVPDTAPPEPPDGPPPRVAAHGTAGCSTTGPHSPASPLLVIVLVSGPRRRKRRA